MWDINELFAEGKAVIENVCGHVLPMSIDLKINYTSKRRWGQCRWKGDDFEVEISHRILDESVEYDKALSVMIHELLHTTAPRAGHKGLWKQRAEMIMNEHPHYLITRTMSNDYFGVKEMEQKYAIACTGCGYIHRSSKLSATIKYPEKYRCKLCGKIFKRI